MICVSCSTLIVTVSSKNQVIEMKIAVLTSGILPVPSVEGGAVEKLVDFFLQYNEEVAHHDITVFSIDRRHHASRSLSSHTFVHYRFLEVSSFFTHTKRWLSKYLFPKGYYDYRINYYERWALRQIAGEEFDIVLIENRPGFAINLRPLTKALIVSHLHNDLLNSSTHRCKEIVEATDRYLCVSNFIADRVKTATGESAWVKTVYNGIDTKHFNTKVPHPSVTRKTLKLHEDDFVVVFFGRITPEKGVKELLEAMLLLKQPYPKIKLLLIGSAFYGANETTTPFIRSLLPLIQQLGDNVVTTGFVHNTLLPQYLHLSDVAVVPSVWEEPSGLVITEAQAAGLPVITTRCGGIPEILGQGGIALEVDEQFVSRLSETILQLYLHLEQRQQYLISYPTHLSYYDKHRFAQEMTETLESWNDRQ